MHRAAGHDRSGGTIPAGMCSPRPFLVGAMLHSSSAACPGIAACRRARRGRGAEQAAEADARADGALRQHAALVCVLCCSVGQLLQEQPGLRSTASLNCSAPRLLLRRAAAAVGLNLCCLPLHLDARIGMATLAAAQCGTPSDSWRACRVCAAAMWCGRCGGALPGLHLCTYLACCRQCLRCWHSSVQRGLRGLAVTAPCLLPPPQIGFGSGFKCNSVVWRALRPIKEMHKVRTAVQIL